MYLMNYLFDFNQTDGIFSGDRTAQAPNPAAAPLYASKNWLYLDTTQPGVVEPGTPIPPGFNPDVLPWINLGDMDTGILLVSQSPPPDDSNFGIRIAQDPLSAPPLVLGGGGPQLTISVCFGKPNRFGRGRTSPFDDGPPARSVKNTYILPLQTSNRVDPLGNPISWFFGLDMVDPVFRPKHGRSSRYEFTVGVIVTNGVVNRHYSHDPEMDITT